MKKSIFIIILLCLNFRLYSCICTTIPFESEYINSDVIVLGVITTMNEDNYELEIIESYKGSEYRKLTGKITNSCSIFPSVGEKWLIYAELRDDSTIFSTSCGSSRSFTSFFSALGYDRQPYPENMTEEQYELNNNIIYGIELQELYFEVNTLRFRKLTNSNLTNNKNHDLKYEPSKYFDILIIVLVVINSLILIFLIFIIIKSIKGKKVC